MPDGVTGADFKAWREPRMSQASAAKALEVSRETVNRWEKAIDKLVPMIAAAMVRGEIVGRADVVAVLHPPKAAKVKAPKAAKPKAAPPPPAQARGRQMRARDGEPAKDEREATPAIREALKRSPLFAKTTVEAFAMRDELARRGKCDRSTTPLIPLRPDWIVIGKYPGHVVKVNAAIPRPLRAVRRGEGWSVVSEDGRLYDYETAAPAGRAA